MDIDEKIDKKLAEWRAVRAKINETTIMHRLEPGKPVVYNSTEDLLNYSILTDQGEILLLEHQLLLNEKDPQLMKLNTDAIKAKIEDLKSEIKKTELLF